MSMSRAHAWGPVILFMGLIFWSSSIPGTPPSPPGEPEKDDFVSIICRYFDKPIHATVYAGLAALVMRALTLRGITWRRAAGVALLICLAFGAGDEWHQSFVLYRESSLDDWIADAIGAFGMILLISRRHLRKPVFSLP